MRGPAVFELGKNVKIEIWGGFNTVGGNCIIVRDRDEAIMLDQGLCFPKFKKYYGGFIQPEIVEDLREVGAIPPRNAYDGVSEVYISHLHLDHLGSLAIPSDYDVKVYVPSKKVLEKLASFWYWSWKELLLPSDYDLSDLEDIVKSKRVKAVQVSHSAFPSYSLLVETSEGSILYTGDFRLESPLGVIKTLENYAGVSSGGVDLLIIEGTNFSRKMTFLTAEDVKRILEKILLKYEYNYLFLSAHPLDIEAFLLVSKIFQERGYNLVFTHTKYAELLDAQLKVLKISDVPNFCLLQLRGRPSGPLEYVRFVDWKELSKEKVVFLTSVTAINELKMLKRGGIDLTNLLQITLTGEPLEEEGRILEAKLGNWLRKLGMNSIRLHLSGHYYPYEFKDVIRTVKPKQVIPIHTRAPDVMKTLFERYKHVL